MRTSAPRTIAAIFVEATPTLPTAVAFVATSTVVSPAGPVDVDSAESLVAPPTPTLPSPTPPI